MILRPISFTCFTSPSGRLDLVATPSVASVCAWACLSPPRVLLFRLSFLLPSCANTVQTHTHTHTATYVRCSRLLPGPVLLRVRRHRTHRRRHLSSSPSFCSRPSHFHTGCTPLKLIRHGNNNRACIPRRLLAVRLPLCVGAKETKPKEGRLHRLPSTTALVHTQLRCRPNRPACVRALALRNIVPTPALSRPRRTCIFPLFSPSPSYAHSLAILLPPSPPPSRVVLASLVDLLRLAPPSSSARSRPPPR